MCGRFAQTLPTDAMAQLFSARPANDLPDVPNFNTCPTTNISVISMDEAGRRLVSMRWGFIPKWYKKPNDGPLLINARAETIADKPAFRDACRARRCLIIASGFYEWTKGADGTRLPWYISRADGEPIVLAGIWQRWGGDDAPVNTCAIVTTGANAVMSEIHHRMPVILSPDDTGLWLGEAGKGAAALMTSAPQDALQFHRVSPAVNSNRASGPGLIEPN
ncbi:MAG: SOS response-associated peptidase [Paracoccaceae bacterium]